MLIWQLDPIDPSDPRWIASKHKRHAIIRASTEERAREIACRAFHMAMTRQVVAQEQLGCLWQHEGIVRCRRLGQSGHRQDGPEEILDPPEYDDEWRP